MPNVPIVAGRQYVAVFENTDPNPNTNWRSLHAQDYYDEQEGESTFIMRPYYGGTYLAQGEGFNLNQNWGHGLPS